MVPSSWFQGRAKLRLILLLHETRNTLLETFYWANVPVRSLMAWLIHFCIYVISSTVYGISDDLLGLG